MADAKLVTSDPADRPERATWALNECSSAFIDCTIHSQDAFALVRYVLALEARLRDADGVKGGNA